MRASNFDCTRVDLIRHGEHLLGDVICGVTDPELSVLGWKQLQSRCQDLIDQGESWDICISSPRKRCFDFAERLSQQHSLDLVIEEGFSELDFGQWEGLSFAEFNRCYPGEWQSWSENPDLAPTHGGESYGEFHNRIRQSWHALFESYRGKRILMFSHGGVIRAIFADIFDLDTSALSRFNIPHACHSRISTYHKPNRPNWFQLDSHNSGFK